MLQDLQDGQRDGRTTPPHLTVEDKESVGVFDDRANVDAAEEEEEER
jgi:hypothetical protein